MIFTTLKKLEGHFIIIKFTNHILQCDMNVCQPAKALPTIPTVICQTLYLRGLIFHSKASIGKRINYPGNDTNCLDMLSSFVVCWNLLFRGGPFTQSPTHVSSLQLYPCFNPSIYPSIHESVCTSSDSPGEISIFQVAGSKTVASTLSHTTTGRKSNVD